MLIHILNTLFKLFICFKIIFGHHQAKSRREGVVKGSEKNKIYKLEYCLKVRQSLSRWRHQEISGWSKETCNYDGQGSGFDNVIK